MKKIIICEKREAAGDLAKSGVFGKGFTEDRMSLENNDFILVWAAGHLYRTVEPKEINENYGFSFKYNTNFDYHMPSLVSEIYDVEHNKPLNNKDTVYKVKVSCLSAIKRALARDDYDEIIFAADADAEGEKIHSDPIKHNKGLLKGKKIKFTRFWNTGSYKNATSVKKAFDARKSISDFKYKNLLDSRTARGNSDYIVGMKLSKVATDIIGSLMAFGRVFSCCVGLIGVRENLIANFVEKPYWNIKGKLGKDSEENANVIQFNHYYEDEDVDDNGNLKKIHETKYFNIEDVEKILKATKDVQFKGKVVNSVKRTTSSNKPPLYSTDDFNVVFMDMFNVDLAYSNMHLEWLRDNGYTTYPGTDGNYFPKEDFNDLNNAVLCAAETFKAEINNIKSNDKQFAVSPLTTDNKIFNDAIAAKQNHLPLHILKALDDKDKALFASNPKYNKGANSGVLKHLKEAYDLIATRCLIQVLPDDIIQKENLTIDIAGYLFEANAEKVIYSGWKQFDKNASRNKNNELGVDYKVGDEIQLTDVFKVDNKTTKPLPYTQKTLLNTLMNPSRALTDEFNAIEDITERKAKMATYQKTKKTLLTVNGVGTQRTRETIFKNLLDRNVIEFYTHKKVKYIRLTEFGKLCFSVTPRYLKSLETTAIWEQKLADIRNGTLTSDEFIELVDKMCSTMVDEIIKNQNIIRDNYNKLNIATNKKNGGGKPTEKQINMIKFIIRQLNLNLDKEQLRSILNSYEQAQLFISDNKDNADKSYKENGAVWKLSENQLKILNHKNVVCPDDINELKNKETLTEEEFKICSDFISKTIEELKSSKKTFSEAQLKILLDERNAKLLTKEVVTLLERNPREYNYDEFTKIKTCLDKIFKSFSNTKK